MKLVDRKTRKAVRKTVKKAVKKHGAKIAAGLAGGIASTLATLASTEAAGTNGKQTNLEKASEKVKHMLGAEGGKARRSTTSDRKLEKRGKRGKKRTPPEPIERAL